MEYQVRLIEKQKDKIISLSKEYNLSEYINDILKGADWVMANWTYNKNPERYFTEIFSLIYVFQFGDLLQHGVKIKSVIENQYFTTKIQEESLTKKILQYLKSLVDNETKAFYYNHFIIEEEEEKATQEDRIFYELQTLKNQGKKLTYSQECFIKDYIYKKHEENKTEDRFKDFFSKKSLQKVIEYERKQHDLKPRTKNKLIGYYVDMLYERYKYDVFGYMQELEIIDSEEIPTIDLNIEKTEEKTEKEIVTQKRWVLHGAEIEDSDNKSQAYDETSFIHITIYKQYCFLYDILRLLNIIVYDENIDENNKKYHYIKQCLSAYKNNKGCRVKN